MNRLINKQFPRKIQEFPRNVQENPRNIQEIPRHFQDFPRNFQEISRNKQRLKQQNVQNVTGLNILYLHVQTPTSCNSDLNIGFLMSNSTYGQLEMPGKWILNDLLMTFFINMFFINLVIGLSYLLLLAIDQSGLDSLCLGSVCPNQSYTLLGEQSSVFGCFFLLGFYRF